MPETTVDFGGDEALYDRLERIAAERDCSVADVLRDAARTVHGEGDGSAGDAGGDADTDPTVVDVEPVGHEGEGRDDADPVDERSPPATDDHAPVRGEADDDRS
ncbi:hypothetical protein ACFO0N_09235 [Halobium salinum]|uniref:Ribbon-helix-helix protein CopG domain-containing protein n=1 Tax=Halobium salinum TaxID=1364940 RepID=A0ABD5PB77_9EURY|nr:hypothetical protein [Halobium salinum]